MNRRQFLRTIAGGSIVPTAIAATSRRATATATGRSTADSSAAESRTVSIERGRRVANQARYDDGTTPDRPPAYESETIAVDRETVAEITAGRTLAADLLDRVETFATVEFELERSRLRVSRQSTADGLRLFVDCPPGVDTNRLSTTVDRIIGQVGSAAIADRLPNHIETVDIEVRDRPDEQLEVDCHRTVGRFADAQYRSEGIPMGAAVRSETLGKIASTGFRGLRNGHSVVVTAAHTFGRETRPPATLRGADLYQPRRPHAVGGCYAVGEAVDAAAVAVDTESYPSRYLADPGGNSYDDQPIVGTASWSVLEAYHAEGRPIYKQGAVSGRCEGRITELTETADGHRELGVDIHSAGGDSGGPYVISTDEGLLVAGIHKGVRSDGSQRRAVFVGSVVSDLDIDIY